MESKDDKEKKNGAAGGQEKELAITISGENAPPQEKTEEDGVEQVPALTLSRVIVFPFALTPLVLSEEKHIRVVEHAAADERLMAFFPEMPEGVKNDPPEPSAAAAGETQNEPAAAGETPPFHPTADGIEFKVAMWNMDGKTVSSIGVLVRIVKMLKFPDGTVRVLVRGLSRIRCLGSGKGKDGLLFARVRKIETKVENNLETVAMIRNATKQFQEIISFSPNFPEDLKIAILNLTDSERIADLISDTLNFSFPEKLAVLTIENFQERLHLLTILLNREVEVLRLGSEIQSQVHNVMSKSQREFFLREQLKQIQKELGEGDRNPDITAIRERMKKISPPEEVRKVLEKETERLETLPQASGEYSVAYSYIDWLLSVPWGVFTEDRLDVRTAGRILDEDHFGLRDVKDRILEFLAILQLKKDRKSPIICFVGPPGVGKTSLGKSIASAMGRKFVRVSLGGVRDEAEIRGHRRTYIGALPGRIIQGMKKAGSSNPVFMLDELDKLSEDYRGAPSAALLEVLDPAQNNAFNDHYLEVDYDLSTVMFIATANIEDTIPGPLRDRMEIIRLPGYTALEKHEIAKRYLIPRQMEENGLVSEDLRFTRSAVDEVISHYTLEAGVRNLERVLGKICRKIAGKIVAGDIPAQANTLVDPDMVRTLLGPRKILEEKLLSKPAVGIVTGLAWTSAGGVTLPVEASKMPGKGDLRLTGSLGNVMKESAMAGFSFLRANAKKFGIRDDVFRKNDFHIHVPDGATPKDGPSAGVTMITAMVSLLTNRPVRPRLAMTGEITLSGRVTAIGGVREKVIAALRAGVYDVILPAENEKDLEEIPEEVRRQLRFKFVENAADVIAFAVPVKIPKITDPAPGARVRKDEIYTFRVPDRKDAAETEKDPGSGKKDDSSAPEEGAVRKTKKRVKTEKDSSAAPKKKKQTANRRGASAEKPVHRRKAK